MDRFAEIEAFFRVVDAGSFSTAAKQLKNCEVSVSGPWPPYHFLPGKLRTVAGNS